MKLEEAIKQTKFKNEHHKAVVNILYTANVLNYQHAQHCKKYNLSVEQFNVLRILRGQHPNAATINLLIDRMLNKTSNASRIVEKLKQKGLLERKTDAEDRRSCMVLITKKGLEVLGKMDKEECFDGTHLINLSESEAKKLNSLLDKIRNSDSINNNQ